MQICRHKPNINPISEKTELRAKSSESFTHYCIIRLNIWFQKSFSLYAKSRELNVKRIYRPICERLRAQRKLNKMHIRSERVISSSLPQVIGCPTAPSTASTKPLTQMQTVMNKTSLHLIMFLRSCLMAQKSVSNKL